MSANIQTLIDKNGNIVYPQTKFNAVVDDNGNTISTHTNNDDIHITSFERNLWNSKSDFSGDYNDLNNKPPMPEMGAFITTTDEKEIANVNPIDADYLQGHRASYFVSKGELENTVNDKLSTTLSTTPVSRFDNDAGYLTEDTLEGINISKFTNDANYLTSHQSLSAYATLNSPTFTGTPKTSANTSYSTPQLRNITISTSDPSGGSNGDIWIKYTG